MLSSQVLQALYPDLVRAANRVNRHAAIGLGGFGVILFLWQREAWYLSLGLVFLALSYWLFSRTRLPSIARARLVGKKSREYRQVGLECLFDFDLLSTADLDGRGGLREERPLQRSLRLRVDKQTYDATDVEAMSAKKWLFLLSHDGTFIQRIEDGKLDERDWRQE